MTEDGRTNRLARCGLIDRHRRHVNVVPRVTAIPLLLSTGEFGRVGILVAQPDLLEQDGCLFGSPARGRFRTCTGPSMTFSNTVRERVESLEHHAGVPAAAREPRFPLPPLGGRLGECCRPSVRR